MTALSAREVEALDCALRATDRQAGEPALDAFGLALGIYVIGDAGRWGIRLPGGLGRVYWQEVES